MSRTLPILTHDYVLIGPTQNPVPHCSVGEIILQCLKNNGKDVAQVDAITGDSVTYEDILKNAINIVKWLQSRGIVPGDCVSVCSENRFELFQVIMACILAGVTCAPLNPIYSEREMEHSMSISKPKVVFTSLLPLSKVEESIARTNFVQDVVVFTDECENKKFVPYDSIVNNKYTDINSFKLPNINPDENVVVILCSSGTTGLPKGVELTHTNMVHLLYYMIDDRYSFVSSKDIGLGLIPGFHGYGYTMSLIAVMKKVKTILMAMFDEEIFLESIQKYKVTMLAAVPPLLVFFAKHPLVDKYDLSSLTDVRCGAAPLSTEIQLEVEKKLKNVKIGQGYGMTETTAIIAVSPPGSMKMGSAGVVAPGNECKVIDLETGKNLKPYQRGELCFRGPLIMKGYRNNPEATAECIEPNGWLHTGDVAYYDEEGNLFIVDRLKELIKYKGFQVPPAELEALLLTHPDVQDAGVIGIPDERAGELPRAFVVRKPGTNVTADQLIKFISGQVSPQKRLYGGVQFIDELPKNPSGKILRKDLRLMYKQSKL